MKNGQLASGSGSTIQETSRLRQWAENLQQDLRFGARSLRKNLGFTVVVLATLALGVGANTAVFSIVNSALLTPLPFGDPSRLYLVFEKTVATERGSVSYPNFLDWQRSSQAFSSLAAFRKDNLVLTGSGHPERLHAAMISSAFLSTLGINPILGREFNQQEDQLGSGGAVLISEDFWRKRFAAQSSVLGTTLQLDGAAYAIIGVVPQAVDSLKIALFSPGDVYLPVGQWRDPSFRDRKVTTGLCVVGRLASGITESSARAEMSKIAGNLAAAYPDANRNIGVNLLALNTLVTAGVKQMLLVLLFTVGFVLLIACTNIANLQLARFTARTREFATRTALGASQNRITVQLLTESVLLALAGGGMGLFLGAGLTRLALRLVPAEIPRANSIGLDERVCLFALGISVGSGILFGLLPALQIRLLNISAALKEGSRGSSTVRHRAQRTFVVVEVALALALLVSSGLMIHSLVNLWHVHPGFDADGVLVFEITPSPGTASDPQKIRVLF